MLPRLSPSQIPSRGITPNQNKRYSRLAGRLIAIIVNQVAVRVPQVSAVPGVVPDSRVAPVSEAAGLRVVLVGVDPAGLARSHQEGREGEHVVRNIAERPSGKLGRCASVVADLDVLVRLGGSAAAVGDG